MGGDEQIMKINWKEIVVYLSVLTGLCIAMILIAFFFLRSGVMV